MRYAIAILILMLTQTASALSPGEACSSRDTDPLKCMACAIKGEDNKSKAGMLAVGGVIMTRKSKGQWGASVCAVVHYPGQFVGAGGRLPTGPKFHEVVAAARQSMQSKGNGFLGFRSYCRSGDVRIGAGGNCYRRSTEMFPGGLATDRTREATLQEIDNILGPRLQMAELPTPNSTR